MAVGFCFRHVRNEELWDKKDKDEIKLFLVPHSNSYSTVRA